MCTSDPEVAVVDNGKVTAVGEGSATILYTVIDVTGCSHVASCDVFVYCGAGIGYIQADGDYTTIEYYNLNGVRVDSESLSPGLYIRKEGKRSTKILVR